MSELESQGYTGAEGTESFLTDLAGDELGGNEVITGLDIKSGGDLAQKYLDLHTSHEEMKSSIPEGAPENGVEGYTFDLPEGIPPEMVDEAATGVFKDFALKRGMSNELFKDLMQFDIARTQQIQSDLKAKAEEGIAALKTEHGDKFDGELNKINKVVLAYGGDDMVKRLDVGNDPGMFKFLSWIGGMISEDTLAKGGVGGHSDSRTKDPETGKARLTFDDMDTK